MKYDTILYKFKIHIRKTTIYTFHKNIHKGKDTH